MQCSTPLKNTLRTLGRAGFMLALRLGFGLGTGAAGGGASAGTACVTPKEGVEFTSAADAGSCGHMALRVAEGSP